MNTSTVSVIITCYNYAQYVGEAIQSILDQTYKNIELIVLNDGSTDDSHAVITKLHKKHAFSYVTRENKGIVHTRNEGLKLATGEYICFLDADDYFNKDYIEKMVEVAKKHDAGVVYPNWRVFGDKEYTVEYKDFTLERLIRQEIHCTSESLIKASEIGNNTFKSEKVAEDWDFFLGLALKGVKFQLAADCYINYRVIQGGRGTARPYWEDVRYFVAILQKWQKLYPEMVDPIDLPIYAGKMRDAHVESQDSIIQEREKIIEEQYSIISEKDTVIEKCEKVGVELRNLQDEYNTLITSRTYRAGIFVMKPVNAVKKITRRIRRSTAAAGKRREDKEIDAAYSKQMQTLEDGAKTGKIAVAIHLFYLDNWPLFLRKLKLLLKNEYDLYITMPEQNTHFIETIKQDFPSVRVVISPNRGRDVLPFMNVLQDIHAKGYSAVLKFHSKKSTHRTDGQEWLESMLNDIIPDDSKKLADVLKIVKQEKFGVLGSADTYYPLTINYPANSHHMNAVLSKIYSQEQADDILQRRREYGFFGGTMFWLGTGAVHELLKFHKAQYFEQEAGQIDGTFAHALERLFCVVAEIEGMDIYESSSEGVGRREYQSDNIPDWSEDHNK